MKGPHRSSCTASPPDHIKPGADVTDYNYSRAIVNLRGSMDKNDRIVYVGLMGYMDMALHSYLIVPQPKAARSGDETETKGP